MMFFAGPTELRSRSFAFYIDAYIQQQKRLYYTLLVQSKGTLQISKKWCFEKYCSCDQAYQVSSL